VEEVVLLELEIMEQIKLQDLEVQEEELVVLVQQHILQEHL
jgi:hypothetical protein